MELIPAIDLKEGQCVRLRQGRMDDTTVFSDDPVSMAGRWVDAGATRLHLVDLDGAFAGSPINHTVIEKICKAFPDLPIQVGGGIRSAETVKSYLDDGVSYTIIGTKAVNEPEFIAGLCQQFPGHIIVGLDAKNGMVATEGWSKMSDHGLIDMAKRFENDGVASIIYTDISKDGMMQGASVDSTVKLAEAINIPVIASGGVSTLEDIEALCKVQGSGIEGAIIGRALYEGTIDLAEAAALVARYQ
ncbi:MAG TPA: 1-(5-phosphoribosyl)-5-[(5-phosphoribosylamino)methylideneamino]imidazole-4-carboxamide isomerase [Gammaproteobacteria bacterium]|nr:1-(5-phosphoribosyl)-5-[(5-phosphoribosylamino)methylideneamino]imidazole-4-carboxamide isomerase [Gammaproteobacteria bacterium]